MSEEKTPWRKNLDKRYISGEDLLNGIAMNKGLRPEMVVTLVKFGDVKAFDQSVQDEKDKTALWLAEYPSKKMLYKPMLLNVTNADFLSRELANGSINIDDSDFTKPFIIYAQPHKRHGHVVRCKKYYPPVAASDTEPIKMLNLCASLDEAMQVWANLSADEKKLPTVIACRDAIKEKFKSQ